MTSAVPMTVRHMFGTPQYFHLHSPVSSESTSCLRLLHLTSHRPPSPLSLMPQVPLRRKLLKELDDIDQSYKRARLSMYLHHAVDFLLPDDEDMSNTSVSVSGVSSVSSISSISSISSFRSGSDISLLLTPEEIMDFCLATVEKEIHKLREEISTTRVLRQTPRVRKASQLHLLTTWRDGNIDQFRQKVRVDPPIFDGILEKIRDHHIFHNNSNVPQLPVENQLAIFLYRAGHYGNAASPEAIGHWAGVSPGTVVNATNRVMVAVLTLHDELIHLPTSDEKESAKRWVAGKVCPEWRDGYLVVDGTKFALFQRPGLHGDAWFDKNHNYSLDCQVRTTPISRVTLADVIVACHASRFPPHRGLCYRPHWQRPRLVGLPVHSHLQATRANLCPWRVGMGRLGISSRVLVCPAIQETSGW